ncbi:hypothetical protein RND71_028954 [Anisodus tanguticus]|uniref:Amine oxidase domain-containing protein n=1 Tax=Anisodus tanguticus TaxID=243964 RepID=A0AAE1RLX6_9SOLA|nr:hypothetical protein RND71_028954 [Anisodus tanguticus]
MSVPSLSHEEDEVDHATHRLCTSREAADVVWFKVTVLEGRKRAGGRVYTKKMKGRNKVAAADLGGSVLTGTLGNPLGLLARQLSYTLHKVRDECPLYHADGKPVDKDLD